MIRYADEVPTADEFISLYSSVGWGNIEKDIAQQALDNTLYCVSCYENEKIVGFGRLIGDKVMFLYIQDVMVIPEYQGEKIGTNIMERLIEKVNELKKVNPNIRTYLGASLGKESFYEKFGFLTRKNANLGEGMVLF